MELGHDVETLSRSDLGSNNTKIKHHKLDLSKNINHVKVFEDVDCIVHTAAKAGIDGNFSDYYTSNFLGTVNLLQASKENGVKYFIYTSSSVVFLVRRYVMEKKICLTFPQEYPLLIH